MNNPICNTFIMFILAALLLGCSEEVAKDSMDEITVQLVWKHQAQFAGFYAAEKNGYYEKENIKVTLLSRSDPTFDVINSVVKGESDFGINYGVGLLEARSKKLPIIAIAAIYQRYPLSFISLKEKGIINPLDFIGRSFRSLTPGGAAVIFDLLLAKNDIDKENILFVPVGYDLNRFFSGEIEVWPGYTINEAIVAQRKGYEINQVRPEDYGVNMLGDTLFTSEMLLHTNPALVMRFVRATIKGWQWAVDHPEVAAKIALQYDNSLDLDHQIAMMKASVPYIQVDDQIGIMSDKVWEEMHNAVLDQNIIEKPLNLDGF